MGVKYFFSCGADFTDFKKKFCCIAKLFFVFLKPILVNEAMNSFKSYIGPHLKGGRVNLIELVEVAIDNRVFREAILRAGGHHDCSGNFFSCCCFVVNLNRKITEQMSLQLRY